MKRLFLTVGIFAFLALIAVAVRSCGTPEEAGAILLDERRLMGTDWSIQIVVHSASGRDLAAQASDLAYRELSRIEALMSEWRQDSPISQVNRSAGLQPVEVPQELAAMIRRGIEYGRITDGAFDISWRGMGNLWHFDEGFVPPSPTAVAEACSRVDYRRIHVVGNRVSLPAGFAIGLGGVAKGYAIDRAGAVLKETGFEDFLVNGGGDVLTSGAKGETPWTVGIKDPRGGPASLVGRLRLTGGAVVTSGDYERFRIVEERRYHHIIDPRTGWPADQCRSVTILAPKAELADVLATSVFVLGPQRGLELVRSNDGVEALVIDASGDRHLTPGFRALFRSEEE